MLKLRASLMAAALCAAAISSAGTQYLMSYTFQLDSAYSTASFLGDFVITNQYPIGGGTGVTYGGDYGVQSADSENVLQDPFPKDELPNGLLIGVVSDLPGDATGQKHIILGMDSTAAGLAANIAWGTLFPNTLEDQLIGSLETIYDPNSSDDQINAAVGDVFTFIDGDATNGILDNQGQSHSAFFSSLSSDVTSQGFTMMSWSDGTQIGTGSVSAQAVPEPASIGALALGIAGLAFRRRKAS